MATLEDAIAYILQHYPHKDELSNARVTKMLYLADWFNLINDKPRITNLKWYFDNYGPFVWDVRKVVSSSELMMIEPTQTMFGDPKEVFRLVGKRVNPDLDDDERAALDHVIAQTRDLGWSAFIRLVYSTYPVASSAKYTYLDLEALAEEYKTQEKRSPTTRK